jgi:RecA-family ATPase
MNSKELNATLRDFERGAQAMEKVYKLERVLKERKQRTHQLTIAAEEMQKRGARQSSIRRFVEAFYEYLIITNKPAQPGNSDPAPVPNSDPPGLLLSEVDTQEITWLWEKRIPRGKITVLDGDPGMGKSLIAAHIAACVSTGRPMPDGTPTRQGGVILIAPEDSPEETLKPRLEAAGGDPSQVLLLNTVEDLDAKRRKIYDRPFSLAQDLDLLENTIKRMQAVLVIIDPLMAVLGNTIDSSRDQSVREVFTPLAQLAERTGCAILMIRHLSRGSAGHPLYRGAGSLGIIAAARSGLIVAADPSDEQRRVLAPTKHNLSQPASNLTYQVVDNECGVPYIHWLEENHHPVQALLSQPSLSYERRAILKALQESPTPLHPVEVASRTGLNHINVRKMLPRLFHAGEIASPARGLYSALEHTNLPANLYENKDVPTETHVPNVSNVSNDKPTQEEDSATLNDESTQGENSVVSTETCVSNVSNSAHSTGEVVQQAIETAPTSLESASNGSSRVVAL